MELLQVLKDDGQLLLTAAGVLLTAVTVMIGLASLLAVFVIPVTIKLMVKREVDAAKKGLAEDMHRIATQKGQIVQAGVSFNYAVLCGRVGRWAFPEGSSQYGVFVDDAISFTEAALDLYTENDRTHENIHRVKNNLAYYLSLRRRPGDGPRAQRIGVEVWEDFQRTGDLEKLNSYASIMKAFPGLYQSEEIRSVIRQLDELIIHNPNASDWHRRNAEPHRAELARILEGRT